ncbi:Mono(ADP-ribosyl)transferase SpvB [Enterobacter cancerogenus]|uniref:Mono(ADP-ribosyl)transferase SpvB n=1 Tax=Enterobacter cancerogenus TaxID=69218 RepID=A0A484WTU9_9ENTR|nr:Mono(ADP-ribosyl)transferase SpvB [Enterobacter cancerogenus]
MQNTDTIKLELPSLPKGGGAITGLKGDMASAGPDGAAVLTLPLPVSAGRGYAPPLALSYHSRAGNGPFGLGWNINQPAVRRRTSKGVPAWDEKDEFTGPDGEVLMPVLDKGGSRMNASPPRYLAQRWKKSSLFQPGAVAPKLILVVWNSGSLSATAGRVSG